MKVRIWDFGDPTIPEPIKREAFRGGDEDWVIVGHADDRNTFERVVELMNPSEAHTCDEKQVVEMEHEGEQLLLYTVCHA